MRLRERYRRLTLWNKVAFWGALASIVALPVALIAMAPMFLPLPSPRPSDSGIAPTTTTAVPAPTVTPSPTRPPSTEREPLVMKPMLHLPRPRLFYGEKALNKMTIVLERGCDEPPTCLRMHAWPREHPEAFGIYGIWMSSREVAANAFGTMSIEFSSQDVKPSMEGWCKAPFEAPHAGYKARWECQASAEDGGEDRVFFRFFNFKPALRNPLLVRMRFRSGSLDSEVAEFTLLPPA